MNGNSNKAALFHTIPSSFVVLRACTAAETRRGSGSREKSNHLRPDEHRLERPFSSTLSANKI